MAKLEWTGTRAVSRIINETTKCAFIISTGLNPYGIWETAVLEADQLFNPKNLFSPFFVVNASTREQAEEQHIQIVSDWQSQDITQLSKSYKLVGTLPLGQLLISETTLNKVAKIWGTVLFRRAYYSMFKRKIRDEHGSFGRTISYLLMEASLTVGLIVALPWSAYTFVGFLTDNLILRILATSIVLISTGLFVIPILGLILMPVFLLLASPIDFVFRRNANPSWKAQLALHGACLLLFGLGKLGTELTNFQVLISISVTITILNLLVFFPLAALKKTRRFLGTFIHASSWPLGVVMWIAAAMDCYRIWGFKGIAAGILLGGVGLLPVGIAACAVEKSWEEGLFLILSVIFTLGFRVIGARIAESSRAVLVAQT